MDLLTLHLNAGVSIFRTTGPRHRCGTISSTLPNLNKLLSPIGSLFYRTHFEVPLDSRNSFYICALAMIGFGVTRTPSTVLR